MPKKKFVIRKFDGDDSYSYAVFRAEDLKGLPRGGPIFFGQAKPLFCGLDRNQAAHYKKICERDAERETIHS